MRRGYFGIGVVHVKKCVNIGTLWRSAHAFGAAFVFTIGRRYAEEASDTTKAGRSVPLYHFGDLGDLLGHLPDACPLVGVELSAGAITLPEYKHRPRACYLLGAEDHGLSPEMLEHCHEVVSIPGASWCLNVATAGSIVLYDRVTRGIVER